MIISDHFQGLQSCLCNGGIQKLRYTQILTPRLFFSLVDNRNLCGFLKA